MGSRYLASSFADLHIKRNCAQAALFKDLYSLGDSSMSIPNLDNEILDLELMLPIMDKTCGGAGWET